MFTLSDMFVGGGPDLFDNVLESPKGYDYNRIVNIKVLYGEDDYETTKYFNMDEHVITEIKDPHPTPNRVRGIGGVIITFEGEDETIWVKRYLFHKGRVYKSETILEE